MDTEDLQIRAEYFVSEANRRLVRTKDPYICPKTQETYYLHVYYDVEYHLDKAKKFYYVRDNKANIHYPKGYVFIKIDTNGNLFYPNGKVPIGTLYSDKRGTEYLDSLSMFIA
jgi:hypothetical protein